MSYRPPKPLDLDQIALFLDFDGTLVHFDRPDDTVPFVDEELRALLGGLYDACGGALAIISGRALDALEEFFLPLRLSAAGEHGSAWRITPEHAVESIERPHGLAAMREYCREYLSHYPQLVLEEKPYSLVLHFHTQPELRDKLALHLGKVCDSEAGVRLLHARGMLEIKSREVNKGAAMLRFMQHRPFNERIPVFVGDDTSDEDAFAVVNELQGISVKVGDGPSLAQYRLPDEDAVRVWLGNLLDPSGDRSAEVWKTES